MKNDRTATQPGTSGIAPRVEARAGAGDSRPLWHAESIDKVLGQFEASREGLTAAEAARRLGEFGPNRLPSAPRRSALVRLFAQFNNLLIYVLMAAAIVAALLHHWIDAAVILAVVLINGVIGFIQEGKAEHALDAIRNMLTAHTSVLREGRRVTVEAEELVPGDVVLLEPGDRVPADLRLLRVRSLQIQEAVLTGESVPVQKSLEPVAEDAPMGDRASVAFSGTLVTAGQGAGIVVGTGVATELGHISALISAVEPLTTPLVRQMNILARRLTVVILGLAGVVFVLAIFLRGFSPSDAFMVVVALGVAAIPEGLPAVMTITLAIGVQRMAARNAIIRRLPAVETLGSVSIICSDKTGTLTRNEMTVDGVVLADAVIEVTGVGYEPYGVFRIDGRDIDLGNHPALNELARAALLCNDAALREDEKSWVVDGDPMEGAFLAFALKAGASSKAMHQAHPRLDEIPFDSGHRYMATLHRDADGGGFICLKGAPERVLEMCGEERHGEGNAPLDANIWRQRIETLAAGGRRVLAIATRSVDADKSDISHVDVEHGLVMLGLVGLLDPPREEAVAAVRDCHGAGIAVKMITGDHAITAGAIARELGLVHHDSVVTGQDIESLSDAELLRVAQNADVFARTSPEHKLRLVQALQADGAVVAMTGDGVNDAPALKRADVGVAMGRKGTEAAKEAAEMVLADDNFASIVAAVREGRTVYDNLRKAIVFLLPINGGETLAIIVGALFMSMLPITPVQILWVNMVSSVALALTLAFESTEPDVMRRPPRVSNEPILSGFLLWRIVLVSLLFVIGIFGMFEWALARGAAIEEARTVAVNTLVVMEVFYLFSVRFLRTPSLTLQGIIGTRAVLIGVSCVAILQFAFTYLPIMQVLFDTRAVAFLDGLAIVGIGVVLLIILEMEKVVRRRIAA